MSLGPKAIVPYPHTVQNLSPIYIGITEPTVQSEPTTWKPAYRDTISGRRVVFARFPGTLGRVAVWVRDSHGTRRLPGVQPLDA